MQRVLLYAAAVAVLLLGTLFISACASRFGYGRTAQVREDEAIEDLLDNWEDYRVFYSGIHAHRPSGLAFDPKRDGRRLDASQWRPIKDKETLNQVFKWMDYNELYPPRLMRILGPDGGLYGYIYTGWDHIIVRTVGAETMSLMDPPSPLPDDYREPIRP